MALETYQNYRRRVGVLLREAVALAEEQRKRDLATDLTRAAEHLEQGRLYVVVCGEFKQGKSSLINALLNEQALFPVDADITTSLVCTIAYGPEERISVLLGEPGKGTRQQQIGRDQIASYATEQGNPENRRQAQLLSIEAPNPQLASGLVLVDTPGIGSVNLHHTAVTQAFLPNADAVIFVSDAGVPLSADELTFVQRVAAQCPQICFVVTKIDARRNYREVVDSNRERLARLLGRAPEQIPITPVSSRLKLDHLRTGDREDLEDSNFPALEAQLWSLLAERRGVLLLLSAVGRLQRVLAQLERPLRAEQQVYESKSQAELDRREAEETAAQERQKQLLDQKALWRSRLTYELADLRTESGDHLKDGFRQIRRDFERYLEDRRVIEQPAGLASLLEADIDQLLGSLGKKVAGGASDIQARIEQLTELNLSEPTLTPLKRDEAQGLQLAVERKQVGWWRRAMSAVREASFERNAAATLLGALGGVVGGGVGMFAGGVGAGPGAVIGGAIGGAIGGVAGTVTGLRKGLERLNEREDGDRRREITAKVKPFLDDQEELVRRKLSGMLRSLERDMQEEFEQLIQQEKRSREATLKAIKDARKLDEGKANQRRAELQRPLEQLQRLRGLAAAIAAEIDARGDDFDEPPGPPEPVREESGDTGSWADE